MEQIQGMVDSIHTKTVTTKFGDKAVYIATVNGHEVNLGFKTSLSQGEQVSLPVEHKYGSYQLVQGQPATNGAANQGGSVGSAGNETAAKAMPSVPPKAAAFPTPQGTKDISIIRQNSLTHATKIVEYMVSSGIIEAIDERAYRDKVLEVAYELQDFSTGWREAKMAEEQGD